MTGFAPNEKMARAAWFQQNEMQRDDVANDNMSAADWRAMMAWVESRANEPAFAEVCHAVSAQAQTYFRTHRVRSV